MWELNEFGDKIALLNDEGMCVTYSELDGIVRLITDMVKERCLVFVMCKNTIGSMVGYVSFIENKVVPVLLNSKMDQQSTTDLIHQYKPSLLWIPREDVDLYRYCTASVLYECFDYLLIQTNFSKKYELYHELGLLLTTSGSTGSPKFVRQSYENISENAKSIVKYLELDSSERPITTLPMNYTYGLSIINSHLMVGATILCTEKGLMQKEFWNFFKQEQATSFGGVPYTYEMLDRLRFGRMDLPSLRYMTQAGGKLTEKLHQKFAELAKTKNIRFVVMYGQCEATARMGYLPAGMAIKKCGSMGIAIPGGQFLLIDEAGNEISEPDKVGELVYKGQNVTLGYAESGEDLCKGDERDGILFTGDMAKRDSDGFYYITGRKKRFLKIYGNRVNLDEVDRMLKGHFQNIDCASTGIDDHMYLFVTDPSVVDAVKHFIVEKTKLNSIAFQVIVIDKIPQNDAGKTLYKELERYYLDVNG